MEDAAGMHVLVGQGWEEELMVQLTLESHGGRVYVAMQSPRGTDMGKRGVV